MNNQILSDFMRFSIDCTTLVESNPGIVSTRWLETGPATKQVEMHRILYKSRSDKCELENSAAKLITNITNI